MVRLAVVGTGRMASIHLKNIMNNPIAKCNHVISNTLSRSQEFIESHKLNSSVIPSQNLELTLKENDNDIDGVVITSNSSQHYDQIKMCLRYNKAVFVEKPMSETLPQIDELFKLASNCNNSPPIFVGYQRRFDPNIQYIYKQIYENNVLIPKHDIPELQKSIGGIEKILTFSKDPKYQDMDYLSSSINCFYDSIIHDIDTICYLTKQFPNKIYCAAHAHYKPIKECNDFDRVFITLHFESGLLGMIDWCRHSGWTYDQRINILGYNGMIQLLNEEENMLSVKHNNIDTNYNLEPNKLKDSNYYYSGYFEDRFAKAYKNEIDEFVDVVQGKTSDIIATHEQVRNVNIILATAEQSARSGQPLEINYNQLALSEYLS